MKIYFTCRRISILRNENSEVDSWHEEQLNDRHKESDIRHHDRTSVITKVLIPNHVYWESETYYKSVYSKAHVL